MDKYLVKPTKIIDENGYSQTITEHVVTHSSGTSGGADQAQINALSKRVYDLEQVNGPINDRIDEAEATANDAKHTADIAHNVAKEVYDDFDMLNSVAANAEKLALEAKYSSETNAEEMTSLKARVADLEETAGTSTVVSVGNSDMGFASEFTECGLPGVTSVKAEWGDEGRSLMFDAKSHLGDVIEELMYVTASGISSIHNRVSTLENSSSSGSVDVLKTQITTTPMLMISDEAEAKLKEISPDFDRNMKNTLDLETTINQSVLSGAAAVTDVEYVIKPLLNEHSNALLSHTNSIQSLDTRTGSHTASIGQLENRMTDVEAQSNTNKSTLNTHILDTNGYFVTYDSAIKKFFSHFAQLVSTIRNNIDSPGTWIADLDAVILNLVPWMGTYHFIDQNIYQP